MTYQKRNKLTSLTISLVILLAISFLYCLYNLNNNAVYYSRYTPHSKDKNPELVMVVSHLDKIELPSKKIYKLNLESDNALIYKKKYTIVENNVIGKRMINILDSQLLNGNGFSYHFSTNGKYLFTINNQNWKKIKSASSKNEALMTITEIIDPIVKAQPKPKINLQWLFDWKYKDRFQ
ncbi:hypothetical protein MXZ84_07890 [Streptococcus uberis]|nr:hypothetical protein [Streptococcus uberis]MCK1202574.1 hypothetical protein [Streptococcus uberis]